MKLDGMTTAELVALRGTIEEKPENREPAGSPWIYNKKTRRKLDQINQAITHNLSVARAAAGRPVPCDGYSGRQSNRRA